MLIKFKIIIGNDINDIENSNTLFHYSSMYSDEAQAVSPAPIRWNPAGFSTLPTIRKY